MQMAYGWVFAYTCLTLLSPFFNFYPPPFKAIHLFLSLIFCREHTDLGRVSWLDIMAEWSSKGVESYGLSNLLSYYPAHMAYAQCKPKVIYM